MHDVENLRPPLFGRNAWNSSSVNQRARFIFMNQLHYGVINSLKANNSVYKPIDRGMMGLGLQYPRVRQNEAPSPDENL